MSEHDSKNAKQQPQKRDQHAIDRNELGDVEHISDLSPDSGVGPSRKKHEQQRLLDATRAGYFEIEGGNAGGLGAPIHVGPELKKDGGPIIGEYEAGYNTYSLPLQSTLRALGRVKDVSMTGAPMTPAELKSRPQLAARFRKLNQVRGDNAQEQAFNQWSAHQTEMKIDIQRFGAGQHEMIAVVTDFRRVQKLIGQRRAEAKKAAKTAELQQLEQVAATLAKVVEFSLDAWNMIGTIEAEVSKQMSFDENAEGVVADGYPTTKDTNWSHGTIDDPHATNAKVPASKDQKVGSAIGAVKQGMDIATQVRNAVRTRTALSLDLKGMFSSMLGSEHVQRVAEIHQQIATLEAQIAHLKLGQELDTIRAAGERLKGFKMEFVANRQEVKADRAASRRAAKAFGKSMNAGEEGIMTMYAAEAWQELAAFGELAAQQRRSMVDPLVGRVHHYLVGNDPLRYAAIGALQDARELMTNTQDVREQRAHFEKHLPEWQQNAKQWNDFLRDRTGAPLVTEDNEADRRSNGP